MRAWCRPGLADSIILGRRKKGGQGSDDESLQADGICHRPPCCAFLPPTYIQLPIRPRRLETTRAHRVSSQCQDPPYPSIYMQSLCCEKPSDAYCISSTQVRSVCRRSYLTPGTSKGPPLPQKMGGMGSREGGARCMEATFALTSFLLAHLSTRLVDGRSDTWDGLG